MYSSDLKIGKFKTWLTKKGAVILAPTNQWELLRFKTVNGVSVIYTNAAGRVTFTGESETAYTAYTKNKSWKAVDRKRQSLRAHKARLAARDGKKCFFCHANLGFDKLTIEHLLSVSHGGTDNDNNLCLACEPCNTTVGNWPVVKKILYRAKKLAEKMYEGLLADDDGNQYEVIFRTEPHIENEPQLLHVLRFTPYGNGEGYEYLRS